MENPDGEERQSGVKNDGMSTEQARGNGGGERPSSAKSTRERQEKIQQLKEKEKLERIKKLEELKEHAQAAARLREEQVTRRLKHFEDLNRKEDERRKQAEERRRMLDEERRLALQTKWDTKETKRTQSVMSASVVSYTSTRSANANASKPVYAFGSCTPRLIENHIDGFLWKSQYNLNVSREPTMRANSAQDLHLQKVRASRSMYEWNQQRTTIDNPLVHQPHRRQLDRIKCKIQNCGYYDGIESRIFCGRRKTDLTPTIPIRRENYDSSMMSRSSSGRVYSSMTRLDRSRSPGHLLSQSQHHHTTTKSPSTKPSRSKSTTHLSSTGLKLTRTEVLRQALTSRKDSKENSSTGVKSSDHTRPPSSMSSSIMSTQSHVQIRPRTIPSRKLRPASVHVTGITDENGDISSSSSSIIKTPVPLKSSTPRPPMKKPEIKKKPDMSSRNNSTASNSSTPSSQPPINYETATMKRPQKKKPQSAPTKEESKKITSQKSPVPVVKNETSNSTPATNHIIAEKSNNNLVDLDIEKPEIVKEKEKLPEPLNNARVTQNFESIESAFASSEFSDSKTPEPSRVLSPSENLLITAVSPAPPATTVTSDQLIDIDSSSLNNNPFSQQDPFASPPMSNIIESTNVIYDQGKSDTLPSQQQQQLLSEQNVMTSSTLSLDSGSGDFENSRSNKIMTEEEAKAKIAEKRRLAREAQEREAARLVEEQRLEEERQRQEAEEAERILEEAKCQEEERLRKAIEEQQKREVEEKKRREEEELARIEKETQEKEAAREAERIRLEMEERLKREEEERLERKKRIEAIMSRTRKKEEQKNAAENSVKETINGHKDNKVLNEENVKSSSNDTTTFNNNYNNNNEFNNGSSSPTTTNGDSNNSTSSTLISFDGMMSVNSGGSNSDMMSQGSNLLVGIGTDVVPSVNTTASNALQDLLS